MKKLLKCGVSALCLTLASVMVVGCSGKPARIAKAGVDFFYFEATNQADAIAVATADVTESDNVIKVMVADNVNCVEVSLNKFLTDNDGVLGANFSFTRDDVTGTGYAYVQVGPGHADPAENLWKKYGAADETAKVMGELPAGPKLYVMSATEVGRSSVYLFATQTGDKLTPFTTTGKTFNLTFKGHDKKTYKLEIKVEAKPTETPEPDPAALRSAVAKTAPVKKASAPKTTAPKTVAPTTKSTKTTTQSTKTTKTTATKPAEPKPVESKKS